MGKKRIFLLSIFFISVYALTTKLIYPEVELSALVTVISILGIGSALIADYVIRYILSKWKDNQ